MEFNDDENTTGYILGLVSNRIRMKLIVAMFLHRRLNEESLFSLLDPGIVQIIAELAAPAFSNDPYWRLCQEIIHDYCYPYNLAYHIEETTFILMTNGKENSGCYVSLALAGSGLDDVLDSAADSLGVGEESEDQQGEAGVNVPVPVPVDTVCVYMMHPALDQFIVRPEQPVFDGFDRNHVGLRLRDPRMQAMTFVEDIEYTIREEEAEACFVTRDYESPAELAAVRNVVDLALSIMLPAPRATVQEGPGCHRCGKPIGEGGVPNALCIECERLLAQMSDA
jgi:hypothetical protein